jgi:RNA polymerase sigma factor (TIGR02999 family)
MLISMHNVTRILQRIENGDAHASAELLPLVYDDLRQLAARELKRDTAGHTLQPTVLVHEVYLRLVDQSHESTWKHRGHFFAAAAQAMRRILVEHARKKRSLKRGGQHQRISLEDAQLEAPARHPDLLALDEALDRLSELRPEVAQLVNLRYFAGLTLEQAADAIGISVRTAARNWSYAKVWLAAAISNSDTP